MSKNKELYKQFLLFLIKKDNVKLSIIMKAKAGIPLDNDDYKKINYNNIKDILFNVHKNDRLNFLNRIIVNSPDFIKNIDSVKISDVTFYLSENDKSLVVNYISKKENSINNFDRKILSSILMKSRRPIALFKKLPKEKRDLIKEYRNNESYPIFALSMSRNKNSVRKILKHYNLI